MSADQVFVFRVLLPLFAATIVATGFVVLVPAIGYLSFLKKFLVLVCLSGLTYALTYYLIKRAGQHIVRRGPRMAEARR